MDDAGGCVISLRDVDQRQRTEEALAEATRQLEMLAATDELTRLANRRTFNRRLEEAFAQARDGADFSLLLLDVDRFKSFNDRYGHPAGDRCLEVVSEVLSACVRTDDEIGARYGGEELALILPGAGPAEALARAEAIRRAVLARAIPHEDAEDGLLHGEHRRRLPLRARPRPGRARRHRPEGRRRSTPRAGAAGTRSVPARPEGRRRGARRPAEAARPAA